MKMDCSNTPGIIICGSLYTYSRDEIADAQKHISECPNCNSLAVKYEKRGKLPYGLKSSAVVMFEIYDTGAGAGRYNVKVIDGQREIDCGRQGSLVVEFLKSISRYQGGAIYAMTK